MTAGLPAGITALPRALVTCLLVLTLAACGDESGSESSRVQPQGYRTGTSGTDGSRPTIAITAPVSSGSFTTATAAIALAGTASDNVGVTRVVWRNTTTGAGGDASGTSSWSVGSLPLIAGSNRLVVRAYDAAGNSRRAILYVTSSGSAPPPDPVNQAPRIAGTPPTSVVAGTAYAFVPSASDPDGQALLFTANGLPSWASVNPSTGALTGAPTASDVGTASGIVISVSDGLASASLPAFSVTVTQNANGTATLAWVPPTTREDGTALTNLAGYRVRYGTSATNLSRVVELAGAGVSRYVVEGLAPGTWYFGVTSYDGVGVESTLSNTASKRIL